MIPSDWQIAVCQICGSTKWQHGSEDKEYRRHTMLYRIREDSYPYHIHMHCLSTILEGIDEFFDHTMRDFVKEKLGLNP